MHADNVDLLFSTASYHIEKLMISTNNIDTSWQGLGILRRTISANKTDLLLKMFETKDADDFCQQD